MTIFNKSETSFGGSSWEQTENLIVAKTTNQIGLLGGGGWIWGGGTVHRRVTSQNRQELFSSLRFTLSLSCMSQERSKWQGHRTRGHNRGQFDEAKHGGFRRCSVVPTALGILLSPSPYISTVPNGQCWCPRSPIKPEENQSTLPLSFGSQFYSFHLILFFNFSELKV